MLHELNDIVSYIERHLFDEDPLGEVERRLAVSPVHARAVFQGLAGMTLAEYLKRRRLSFASARLASGAAVSEVAFHCGYDSTDGFARAYKRWAGCSPSETARTGRATSMPPIHFTIAIQGGVTMEYRIVDMPAFSFAGVSARVPLQFEGVNAAIVELAQSITPEQREEMHRLQDVEPCEVVNASWNSDTGFTEESGELTHLIGVLTTSTDAACGLELVPVPAGTWAVFPCEGAFPDVMQETTARVYAEWLADAAWVLRDALMFSFTRHDAARPDHAYSEIWMPVEPRVR